MNNFVHFIHPYMNPLPSFWMCTQTVSHYPLSISTKKLSTNVFLFCTNIPEPLFLFVLERTALIAKLSANESLGNIILMMINCFCGMAGRHKAFSLISNRDYCQRFSPSQIYDTPRAKLEPAQKLSPGFVEWSCAVVKTTNQLISRISWRIYIGKIFVQL